ncbi:hypothetical protein BOX15_Mlig026384g1, partial [Macrostomum lignano]
SSSSSFTSAGFQAGISCAALHASTGSRTLTGTARSNFFRQRFSSAQAMATAEQLGAALDANDREQLLRLCRRVGSNLTVKTNDGFEESLAHHLAWKPYGLDCLKVLVERLGPSCLTQARNQYGDAPLHWVAIFQDENSMEFIHSRIGAECFELKGRYNRSIAFIAAENKRSNSILKWIARKKGPGFLTAVDSSGDSPVHTAALRQGSDSMQFFKSLFGPDCFFQKGDLGRTAIHRAALNKSSNSALKWLVSECGSDSLKEKDDEGNTPIHLAALEQGEDSMQFFKSLFGPDCFFQKGSVGRTAIHCAAGNESSNSALKWLVSKCGSDSLLEKDDQGNTPIHWAALFQGSDSMQFIKEQLGSLVFMLKNLGGETSVHYAARNESSNSAFAWCIKDLGTKCLLVKDSSQSLPIHLAAQYQGVDSLRLIKETLGVAAFRLTGHRGQTVAHYAAANSEKQQLMAWLVTEVGPRCLVVVDQRGKTAADLAGYYE